jgi:hypothetical protein
MNLSDRELRVILKWFDISQDHLDDDDLKLYDKITDYLDTELEEESEDDDAFSFDYDEDNFNYDEDEDD